MSFGMLLRAFRERGLWSQEQLAERSGLSIRTIGRLEQGRVGHPRGESVRLLADALGLMGQQRQQFEDAARPLPAGSPGTAAGSWAAPGQLVPCQLPPGVADFTGRSEEVGLLRDLLTATARAGPAVVTVAAVAGKAGVGKTALAIHLAHQVRGRFPDGQLYVNLRGAEHHPLDAATVLARFLRALGLDGAAIPRGLDERGALYRARLADRRVLVVLDDVASEVQVRPLLPGTPGCAVLVTSRTRLTGLEGARRLDLEVLDEAPAIELLGRIVGAERVAADQQAAAAIVGYCGRLPLAIRIAGGRLAGRPHWPLARLAERLADERRRLDELSARNLEVRASVALSYRGLDENARRVFRRLGLLQAPDFPAWVVAALLDIPLGQAEELAENLVEAQLLEIAGVDQVGQLRYRFHSLLRLFAHERATAEDSTEQQTASVARALGGWLALAERAEQHAPDRTPGLPHGDALRWQPAPAGPAAVLDRPLDWFEAERTALISAVQQANAVGMDELAWDLTGCLSSFLETRGWYDDWASTHQLALASAHRTGNGYGEAYLLRRLGDLHMDQNRYDEAGSCYEAALGVSDAIGDDRGCAYAVCSLGCVQQTRGLLDEAIASYSRAWSSFQRIDDRRGQAQALYGMGAVCQERGLVTKALEHFQEALVAFRDVGEQRGEAHLLRWVGSLHASMERYDQAEEVLREGLAVHRTLGDRLGEAYALGTLGELSIRRRRFIEAGSALDESLQIFHELGNQSGQGWVLRNLGLLRIAQHRIAEAQNHLHESVRRFRNLRMPLGEGRGLVGIGDAHLAEGDDERARQVYERALGLFEQLGVPETAQIRDRLQQLTVGASKAASADA